jgi:hypothetical protein
MPEVSETEAEAPAEIETLPEETPPVLQLITLGTDDAPTCTDGVCR